MTEQALDSKATVSAELPSKKAYVVEKPRVPLVLKLFGLTALLIAIVVAVAVVGASEEGIARALAWGVLAAQTAMRMRTLRRVKSVSFSFVMTSSLSGESGEVKSIS